MKLIFAMGLFITIPVINHTDNVLTRFKLPAGYHQIAARPGSFGAYLEDLPLKPAGTHTETYNGSVARTDIFTGAVVDMSVGKEDLQQCADAVMRLRGEYLYHQKKFNDIIFHFTSGFKCDYLHYAEGYRYHNDKWVMKAGKDYSYKGFMRYMELIFAYAGTLSLQKELQPVTNAADLITGDVFIHGGSPGHCFIVMDVIENEHHEKEFLLAQSFMPAQNIQVLQYNGNPWFTTGKLSGIWYGDLISKDYLKKFD